MDNKPISAAALTEAERMQDELHSYACALLNDNPNLQYKDAVIVWIILEIAKLKTNGTISIATGD